MAKKTFSTVGLVALLMSIGSLLVKEYVKPESPVMDYRGFGQSPTKPLHADEPGAYRTSL